MSEGKKVFCVGCCKYRDAGEFTKDKEKYICDPCCKEGLEFAFWMAEQVTGKRELRIEKERGNRVGE